MLEWFVSSAALTALVIGLRYALRGRVSLRLQYALWALVLLRLLMAVRLLGIIAVTGKGLAKLSSELPEFYVTRRNIPLECSDADIRQKLSKQPCDVTKEGIAVNLASGRVLLTPTRSGRTLRILSEAENYELSKELCGEIEKILKGKN